MKIGRLYQAGIKPDCESQFWCVPHIGLGKDEFIGDIAVQADNKIVAVGGSNDVGNSENTALARYNSNGTLDTGFGNAGVIIADLGGDDEAAAVAIQQNDGRIVLAGVSDLGNNPNFLLARYHAFTCNDFNVTRVGTLGDDNIFIFGPSRETIVINGLDGNDTISGSQMNDIICGGGGNDSISGLNGNDTLFGQAGDDSLNGGGGGDTCNGGGQGGDTFTSCETITTNNSGYSGVFAGDITQNCSGSGDDLSCTLEGELDVDNPGTETAPEAVTRFFLSFDEVLDEEDVVIQEIFVGPLEPGGIEQVAFTAELPRGQDATGQFVLAQLDADDVVPEQNEENNLVVSSAIDLGGNEGGGCNTLAGSVPVGTSAANIIILLIPAFAVGFRMLIREKRKK